MLLLNRRLATPEQQGMRVVLAKRGAALANFFSVNPLGIGFKAAAFSGWRRLPRPVIVNGVGLVVCRIGINIHPVHAVALEVMVRAGGLIDRDFMEIRPAEAANLRIGIGEESALKQRVVAEVYPRNDMPRMERRLFVFGKKVIRVAIEDHLTDALHRDQRFRNQLGGIQQIEIKSKLVLFRDQL